MKPTNTKLPFFSVVIPAYNEEEFIGATLESLKKQNYQEKFEVIVVDNNSTDKTATIAREHNAKVIFEPCKGTARARQTGFENAKGSIIISTDADVLFPQKWLSTYEKEFKKHPEAVVISGMYDFHDGSLSLKILHWLFNYWLFCIFDWYSEANMAVKKWAFIKNGSFDTKFLIAEGSELGRRLRKFGKVYRSANFNKVHTSARRHNKLGIWATIWELAYIHIRYKLQKSPNVKPFRSGSEVPQLGLLPKIAINFMVTITILTSLLGGIFEIKQVRAQVIKREHQLKLRISKVDIDLPSVHALHHVHH